MLFNYIFLISNYEPGHLSATSKETEEEFIIPLSGNMLNNRREIFNDLSTSNHRFAFLILPEVIAGYIEKPNTNLIQFITSLLFLPNYIRIKGNYVLLLNSAQTDSGPLTLFTESLKSELNLQGIVNLNIETLDMGDSEHIPQAPATIAVNKKLLTLLTESPVAIDFEANLKSFLKLRLLDKKWLIPFNSAEQLLHFHSVIRKLEFNFVSTYPVLTHYINHYNTLETSSFKLDEENKFLKIKLTNSMQYLKLLRETSQGQINHLTNLVYRHNHPLPGEAGSDIIERLENLQTSRDEILAWYSKEYEVLPKWYKRFGHVLKVFMGKRTFKSLFK